MNKESFDSLHGYVYLFQCGDQYKIGYSKTPVKRRQQFRTGSPFPVKTVHLLRTVYYRQIEKQLHYQFADKRKQGEWFALDDADVAYIKSLNKNGNTPEEQEESDREWQASQDQVEREFNAKRRLEAQQAIALVAAV